MSTSHCYSKRLSGCVGLRQEAFETRDFYLACFLRCSGYDLIDLRAEGQRKVFVFRDRPTRRDDVLAFYGDAISVRPLARAHPALGADCASVGTRS